MADQTYIQVAPFPDILNDLVKRCSYRPNWTVDLAEDAERDLDGEKTVISHGLTLIITTRGYDSRHPDRGPHYGVQHYFPVPPATYDYRSWRRWLLDQFLKVEVHEACEFFDIEGDEFPYAPSHGPGNDPYIVREIGTDEDRRTRFTGELLPE